MPREMSHTPPLPPRNASSANNLPTPPTPSYPKNSTTDTLHITDIEDGDGNARGGRKRPLVTMNDVKTEWKTGSKLRVIKYYVVPAGVGLLVGCIIGVVVWLCKQFID